MDEVDIDLSGQTPREVSTTELESCDIVATMGCSTLDIDDAKADIRDWSLDDPHNKTIEEVRAIRDEIENRVKTLFDQAETQITQ
jgi:arsenate reductase